MRTATNNARRAFQELDRFSGEQCARFVRAASGSPSRRAGRAALCLVLCLVPASFLFLPALLDGSIKHPVAAWSFRGTGIFTLLGALALLAAPALYLVIRNRLIHRRIRHVLRARGVCSGCRYRLIGVPVRPGNSVTCPECGIKCEVDPSLDELVDDDHGQPIFSPLPDPSLAPRFFTPHRIRATKRWLLYGAAGLLTSALVLSAGYELFLRRQAARARASLHPASALTALGESVQGAPADPDNPDGWQLMFIAHEEKSRIDSRVWRDTPILTADGQRVTPDPSMIAATRSDGRSEREQKRDTACDALSRRMIDEYREAGLYAALARFNTARRALPDLALTSSNMTAFAALRDLARVNAGRMIVARERKDLAEFTAAFENNLAISRILRLQPLLICDLLRVSTDTPTIKQARAVLMSHPTGDWIDAMDGALERQRTTLSFALALEGERIFNLARISEFFADPSNVRFGQFSPAVRSMFGPLSSIYPSLRVGTYEDNKNEMNAFIDNLIAASKLPRRDRPPPESSYRCLLVRCAVPTYAVSIDDHDRLELEHRGLHLMIALERFRNANNRYPDSLPQLIPRHMAQLPLDVWTGEPFGYKLIDPATDPHRRGYILYSFGNDDTDNGGNSGAANYGRDLNTVTSPETPDPPQGDFVINAPD